MHNKVAKITDSLKSFFEKAGKTRAVLGLSGGIDSALVAKLAVMVLGSDNVTVLILPNEGLTTQDNIDDAESWAKELGIKYENISINQFIEQFDKMPWSASDIANMNVQARVRANIMYHYANTHDSLVLGTGNKTELMLGYFTKYGDGAVDCEVIGNLYKTEVWAISKELGLPEVIINKAPTAQLAEGQTDESEIGMNYQEIDSILQKFESGGSSETENEKKLWERIQNNKHKGEIPPSI